MKRSALGLLFLAVFASYATSATAATFYVSPGESIQSAIDEASDGDTVIVRDGTYTGPGNRNITFGGKAILLKSEHGWADTIIDSQGTEQSPQSVFVFTSGETQSTVVEGFTITGGYADGDTDATRAGGAIYCRNASPTIRNNFITINSAQGPGGAIACFDSSPVLENNSIIANVSQTDGGGIYVSGGSPTLTGNEIAANSAYTSGGGLYVTLATVELTGNTISNNTAEKAGGGLALFRTAENVQMRGNVIAQNTAAESGGGLSANVCDLLLDGLTITGNSATQNGGGIFLQQTTATLTNSILWTDSAKSGKEIAQDALSDLAVRYSDVLGGEKAVANGGGNLEWADTNIAADPLFGDAVAGDYHLQSTVGRWDPYAADTAGAWVQDNAQSPCIDTGDPAASYAIETAPNGGRPNLGAYGNTAVASRSNLPVHSLAVDSQPESGIEIKCSAPDVYGKVGGLTGFTATYFENMSVTLTAPEIAQAGGANYIFKQWVVDGQPKPEGERSLEFTITGDTTVRAEYQVQMHLEFTASPDTTAAGEKLSPAAKVALKDSTGGTVLSSSAPIAVRLKENTGTPEAKLEGTTSVKAAEGEATFDDLTITTAGSGYVLEALVDGLPVAESEPFTVASSSPERLEFVKTPGTSALDKPLAPAPQVSVRDKFGNPCSASVTVSLKPGTGTSEAVLSGTLTAEAVDGIATFNNLIIDKIAQGYQLVARSDGWLSAISSAFDVTAMPDLTIEKLTDTSQGVRSGNSIVYTIVYGNTGTGAATDTVITDSIPAGTTFLYASDGGVYNESTHEVQWLVGDLPPAAQNRTVSLEVSVLPTMADGGRVSNNAYYIACKETEAVYGRPVRTDILDTSPPKVSESIPDADAIQVPTDSIIEITLADAGSGVDYSAVQIALDAENGGGIIYDGSAENDGVYQSQWGICRRIGSPKKMKFRFQAAAPFRHHQQVHVTVNAADLAGNTMPAKAFTFATTMQMFGVNHKLNQTSGTHNPASAVGPGGAIWTAWDQDNGANGTDVFVRLHPANARKFSPPVDVTAVPADQRNPALAVDSNGRAYVVWEEGGSGNWDLYCSTSIDGTSWTWPKRINGSTTADQQAPAIAIDSQNHVYVAWQDTRSGNSDIYLARSTDSGATWSEVRITSDAAEQTQPALVIGPNDYAYVFWTDLRSGNADIYGANATDGPWTNRPIITGEGEQSQPAAAMESDGRIHLAWVDDSAGNKDILYASSTTFFQNDGSITGTEVADDSTGADQDQPSIAVVEGAGAPDTYDVSEPRVCIAWRDYRNASDNAGDTDIYYAETAFGSDDAFGTNVLVNSDGTTAQQQMPQVGIDDRGLPFVAWIDLRAGLPDVAFARAFGAGRPIAIGRLNHTGGCVERQGKNRHGIPTDADDVILDMPSGSLESDADIDISEAEGAPPAPMGGLGSAYHFGPSGMHFQHPVTITLPHTAADCPNHKAWQVYWFNEMTGMWSTEGISNVRHVLLGNNLHAVQFNTTHFSVFTVGGGQIAGSDSSGGGGGGGGCFIATAAYGTPMANDVRYLRAFRDQYLMRTDLGQAFVQLYYATSPPIADLIRQNDAAKGIIRMGLKPLINWSKQHVSKKAFEQETADKP